jgi:integrase
MRRSELLTMEWCNVDLGQRYVLLTVTKNGEPRSVPLSTKAVLILEGLPKVIGGMVFPVSASALKGAWERACARAGISDLHFHDLRHEATSRIALKLPNLIELASVTGHKDVRMLGRYYHPRAAELALKLG